jgi:hypothetical protein
MDRGRIEFEIEDFFCVALIDGYTSSDIIKFAEHIAKLSRQETLSEVKAALDKLQDGKK